METITQTINFKKISLRNTYELLKFFKITIELKKKVQILLSPLVYEIILLISCKN